MVRRDARAADRAPDNGAAVVEFVLVGLLLLFVFLGVVQVGLVLHTRNVLAADAAEGARHAANLGVDPSSGGPWTQALIAHSLAGAAREVRCTGGSTVGPGGLPLATVTCDGRMRLTFLPLGVSVPLHVTARAVKETAQ